MEVLPTFSKIICSTELNLSEKEYTIIEDYLSKLSLFESDDHYAVPTEDKFVLRHDTLSFLHDKIMSEFNRLNSEHLKYDNQFVMNTSWYTYSKPGQYATFHNHSNCMFSGVFYIQSNQETDKIAFSDFKTSTWLLEFKEQNIYNKIFLR